MSEPSRRHAPRALITSRFFVPETNAGVFRLQVAAAALVKRGFLVDVLTTIPPKGAEPVRDDPAVRVSRWPVLRDRGGNVRGYLQYASFDIPLLFRMLLRRFDVAISEAPPTTGIIAGMVARARRRPFVYYAADVWTDGVQAVGSPPPVVAVMRVLERRVLRLATRILSVSPDVTERLVSLGAPRERIVLVGHGIDSTVFSPSVEPAGEASGRYFVYTGTMSEVHSPQVFVDAFARIAADFPDISLRFYGQGVFEPELRQMAHRLAPGRVSFGGVVSPREAARWIRGATGALVSLTPGLGYDFAHPTKAYAAAACGTPVIYAGPDSFGDTVRQAGLGEAVWHEPELVAGAMRRLLAQSSERIDSAREARARWARESVSLQAVGERVAAVATEVTPTSMKGGLRLPADPNHAGNGREGQT
jgi:glycosyltransferase involved in cell wall biosynthesis